MSDEKVTVFVSGHCGPCQEVKSLIEAGKFNVEDIDMIDVESEDGFHWIKDKNLTKVPSAFRGSRECKLGFAEDGEMLVIDCGDPVTEEVAP